MKTRIVSKPSASGNPLKRRQFLALTAASAAVSATGALTPLAEAAPATKTPASTSGGWRFNAVYTGEHLSRIAFPMGGMGAGMICLEGLGAFSHVSLRHRPEVFHQPCLFAAVSVKGQPGTAKVLEGPVQPWKIFGAGNTGNGAPGATYGLPRFRAAAFAVRFPFATVTLNDPNMPLRVELTGWSPFIPGDADSSSLPVAGLEYRFTNPTKKPLEAVFSFNAKNFMVVGSNAQAIKPIRGGFMLWGGAPADRPWEEGAFCAVVDEPDVKVNHAWFRGGWWDPLTMAWKDIAAAAAYDRPPVTEGGPSPGATLFVPFTVAPGASRTIIVKLAWYVGHTNQRIGRDPANTPAPKEYYRPWYAGRFKGVEEVAEFWRTRYDELRRGSAAFAECFYSSTLPPEVLEAVAANLTILKSPTVLRQADGRLWGWEGCSDGSGCCHGTCTHVWNYAQAIPHLFPDLERTLRDTEFNFSQDKRGHQTFRSALPIRPIEPDFHAAADGQLGGIMKVFREWRLSGDTEWLRRLWPKVRQSLDYCIATWDPGEKGVLEEPHHNTYDIEFWGPNGMCTSFYLGALKAAVLMGQALGDNVARYAQLLEKGIYKTESELFDGEYFIQKIEWKNLRAGNPVENKSMVGSYSPEALQLLEKEGPKYQYGKGCLSDGVLGDWLAQVCGVGPVLDTQKVTSHLRAVHRYNLKHDLTDYPNPQRPSYACGAEGGLLLCTWPKGGELSLPFVYSNEVWTGIEYQVASHLMLMGRVEEGLEIVRVCRRRYDGRIRNPFNEYECGHWYARAMSSYALLQGLTGARYDAVTKTLHLAPKIKGDWRAFFSAHGSFGTVGMKRGKPFYEPVRGQLDIQRFEVH
ncbi:GH116 family glycosyl hydrolase [Fontisphaera persica]|uniref:GH116 family glycosyl hydrolase n=1 Tax=Fontisphaera persica TaxID=2974023 RepID=UPI0024BFB1A2|nr:GH116 family glycosyl hydrolase [Fontisphaera persica]WCJ58802.1 GH116 family glycosyl hydrolase [Fontisphaera persica]